MVETLAESDVAEKHADSPAWLEEGVVLTVNSNKGGVGKTTILMMVAYYLAELLSKMGLDFEILLIDFDHQCNLSTNVGFAMDGADGRGVKDPDTGELIQGPLYSADDIIMTSTEDEPPGWAERMIEPIRWVLKTAEGTPILHPVTGEVQPDPINQYIKIIPGHPDLEKRYTLISEADFRFRLDHALTGLKKRRIVLIDTGPGMGPLVEQAWAASDAVLGVAALYYNEMEGALKARNKILRTRKALGRPSLDMVGVVVNEYSKTKSTQSKNLTTLIGALGEERIWTDAKVPEVELIAKIVDQQKSFGRLHGSFKSKNTVKTAGEALARKVLEVISRAA